jgi:hypothetical protein
MKQEPLYDILDFEGNRIYTGYADDPQCAMYYSPITNDIVHYQDIERNEWTVIESGHYAEVWK